ncbi:MAG: hypothetical protein V8Q84_00235 [Bilophila sp.]
MIQHVRFETASRRSGDSGPQGVSVPLTSHVISLEIADTLKAWMEKGEFLLTEAVNSIPAY